MELLAGKLSLTTEEVLGQGRVLQPIKIARWEDRCGSVQLCSAARYLQLLHSGGVLQRGVKLCLRR